MPEVLARVKAGEPDPACLMADGAATCVCAFNHIRALPALNTPDQFKAAAPLFQRAGADGNPSELPPGVVAAVRSCAPSAAHS